MKTTVTVNGNVLLGMAMLAMLASKDESGPVVQGVRLRVFKEEKDGKNAIWIATDGRRLGLYHDKVEMVFPPEVTEPFVELTIVPPRVIKPTKKQPNLTFEHEVIPASETPTVGGLNKNYKPETISCLYRGGNLTEKCTLPVGTGYPAWKKVVPTTPAVASAQLCFNIELLHGFYQAAAKITGSKTAPTGMVVQPGDANNLNPIIIRFQIPYDFYGILMPLRCEKTYTMPEFVKAQPERSQKELPDAIWT